MTVPGATQIGAGPAPVRQRSPGQPRRLYADDAPRNRRSPPTSGFPASAIARPSAHRVRRGRLNSTRASGRGARRQEGTCRVTRSVPGLAECRAVALPGGTHRDAVERELPMSTCSSKSLRTSRRARYRRARARQWSDACQWGSGAADVEAGSRGPPVEVDGIAERGTRSVASPAPICNRVMTRPGTIGGRVVGGC